MLTGEESLASSISGIYLIALFIRLFLLYSNVHKKELALFKYFLQLLSDAN